MLRALYSKTRSLQTFERKGALGDQEKAGLRCLRCIVYADDVHWILSNVNIFLLHFNHFLGQAE